MVLSGLVRNYIYLSLRGPSPQLFSVHVCERLNAPPYGRHGVNVNVDFYAGVVYHLLGIPEDLFVSIFAIGRVPGWTLQVLEQLDGNILIRPRLHYTGPGPRAYPPIAER